MKNAIVTGASGFLGRWLVKELLKNDINVIAVVRKDSNNLKFLPKSDRLTLIYASMNEYVNLSDNMNRLEDCVFYHLAWDGVSGIRRSDLDVQMANVRGAVQSVKLAKILGCTSFIGLGSIMEFEALAACGEDGALPGNAYVYGEAKHYAHLATKIEAAKLGIKHIWPILTNAYGEYELSSRFINNTIRKMINREPLEFTAGNQLYDFIHVEDAVRALFLLGDMGKAFHQYILGSGTVQPLRKYIETLGNVLAPEQRLLFGNIPYTGAMLPKNIFSTESLNRDTGFVPSVSFEDGIKRTYKWLQEGENADGF